MRMTHFEFVMLSNARRTSTFISFRTSLRPDPAIDCTLYRFPSTTQTGSWVKQKKLGNHMPETNNLQTFQVFSQQSKHKIK